MKPCTHRKTVAGCIYCVTGNCASCDKGKSAWRETHKAFLCLSCNSDWSHRAEIESLSRQLDALKAEKERLREHNAHLIGEISRQADVLMQAGKDWDCERGRAEAAERERDTLRDAVREWMQKWDAAKEPMMAIYTSALIHGVEYRGPDMSSEIEKLRSLVPDPSASQK